MTCWHGLPRGLTWSVHFVFSVMLLQSIGFYVGNLEIRLIVRRSRMRFAAFAAWADITGLFRSACLDDMLLDFEIVSVYLHDYEMYVFCVTERSCNTNYGIVILSSVNY